MKVNNYKKKTEKTIVITTVAMRSKWNGKTTNFTKQKHLGEPQA